MGQSRCIAGPSLCHTEHVEVTSLQDFIAGHNTASRPSLPCPTAPKGMQLLQKTYSDYRRIIGALNRPEAILDLDLLDANIAAILERAGELPIRIASKSVRSVEVLRYIQRSSARFQGIMCFSASEALFLLEQGFDDLLMGYPTTDVPGIAALAKAIASGSKVTFMADHIDQLKMLDRAGSMAGVQIPYCLDIDMSSRFPGIHFGVFRSPLRSVEDVQSLCDQADRLPNIKLRGLMGYEAQIAGLADAPKGLDLRTRFIAWLKKRSVRELRARRKAITELLKARYPDLDLVNGGGTGSLESTRQEPWVTELTVGSGFFAPALFDAYRAFKHLPALFFALPVVRIPQEGMITCAGGGYHASGPAGISRLPTPYLPTGLRYVPDEGAGEVQTPLHDPSGTLRIGDPVFFRHAKAGELCERFTRLLVIKDGKLQPTSINTYRGDGQCFP